MSNPEKIRIVFQGSCPKLTSRGKGVLCYEMGVDSTDKPYIRVSRNEQGGTCSYEWLSLSGIEDLFAARDEPKAHFNATLFQKLFVSRSANNHGFLAAILRSEKVIGSVLEKPTQLVLQSFAEIKTKISELSAKEIELTDHVAVELEKREELKKKRLAEKKVASKPKSVRKKQ